MLLGGFNEIIHVESSEPCLTHTKSLSKNITLPTKVRLVKAMDFPVVKYGFKSWTIKNTEHMLLNLMLEKTLESPLDCKEIQRVHPKGNQS